MCPNSQAAPSVVAKQVSAACSSDRCCVFGLRRTGQRRSPACRIEEDISISVTVSRSGLLWPVYGKERRGRAGRTRGQRSGHNDWRSACESSPSSAGLGGSGVTSVLVLCVLSDPGSWGKSLKNYCVLSRSRSEIQKWLRVLKVAAVTHMKLCWNMRHKVELAFKMTRREVWHHGFACMCCKNTLQEI